MCKKTDEMKKEKKYNLPNRPRELEMKLETDQFFSQYDRNGHCFWSYKALYSLWRSFTSLSLIIVHIADIILLIF